MNREQTAEVLNSLIEACHDGENGFHAAAEAVEDPDLKVFFTRYATQRAEYATELQALVDALGASPQAGGTAAAAVHRGWINLKSALTAKDPAAIVAEAKRGEQVAAGEYRQALEKVLPSDVREHVQKQYAGVLESNDRFTRMEYRRLPEEVERLMVGREEW